MNSLPQHVVPEAVPERTLDLAKLAGVSPRDEIRVVGFVNRTLDLFEQTLDLVKASQPAQKKVAGTAASVRFIPQHDDLRARFKFAEVLGSYATLNTLLDQYAPAYEISRAMSVDHAISQLSDAEVRLLGDYREQIEAALTHASGHLDTINISEFSEQELAELNEILREARSRYEELDRILGLRLIYDVERAVERLHSLVGKIATVQRSVTGVFLVESEIMFVPSADLVQIVNDIFKAIGNPFVVDNIDGTILLAARNLLIHVMSFYAYYGREQIYQILGDGSSRGGRHRVAAQIRNEIRCLFQACKANNKLVLTRVMDDAEREFEISVEALQNEAANHAIAEVERLIPKKVVRPPPPKPSLLTRLSRWLFRGDQ